MPYRWTQPEARLVANTDLIVFEEVYTIMRCIITEAKLGNYEAVIEDETIMTESTPEVPVLATTANPTVLAGDTLILDGTTITLTGGSINSVINDINDYNLDYVTASKQDNKLLLTYAGPDTAWNFEVGNGTANSKIGLLVNTYAPFTPNSMEYYRTWAGTKDDRKRWDQIQQVQAYFHNLGYDLNIMVNPCTNRTFIWKAYW